MPEAGSQKDKALPSVRVPHTFGPGENDINALNENFAFVCARIADLMQQNTALNDRLLGLEQKGKNQQ